MFRKILVLLLGIALLVSVTPVSAIPEEEAAFNALLETQAKSNELYTALLLSYTQDGEIVYPDYYAGAYANEQGNMVVMVTALTEDVKNEVIKTVGSDEFIFEEAKYSYNYLSELRDSIMDYCEDNRKTSKAAQLITNAGISNDDNMVVVGLEEVTPEITDTLTAAAESGGMKRQNPEDLPLVFEKSGRMEEYATVNSGDKINNNVGNISVGFPVQLRNPFDGEWDNGFVTCGHGLTASQTIYYNGVGIGDVEINEHIHDTPYDFSVVLSRSGHSHSRKVIHSNGRSYNVEGAVYVLENTTVYKRGFATGVTQGYVINTNASVSINGYTTTGLTVVKNMVTNSGDSGGLVYTIYSDTVGISLAAGIVKGGSKSFNGNYGDFTCFVPSYTIIQHPDHDIRMG